MADRQGWMDGWKEGWVVRIGRNNSTGERESIYQYTSQVVPYTS